MKTLIEAFVVMVFTVFGAYGLSQSNFNIFEQAKKFSLQKASTDLVNMSNISGQLTQSKKVKRLF